MPYPVVPDVPGSFQADPVVPTQKVNVLAANTQPTLALDSELVALSPNNTGLPVNLGNIVQKAHAVSSGSVASLTCAFTNPVAAGNTLIVSCGTGNNGSITVTDTLSNTWNQAKKQANSTTFEGGIFYATPTTAGADTITVTPSASVEVAIQIYEVAGLLAQSASILDQTAGSTGTGTSTTTAAIVPASPNELAFAVVAVGGGAEATSVTSGTFWNLDSTQNVGGSPSGLFSFGALSQPLGSIASITPQATIAGSQAWAMAVATFRPVILGVEGTVNLAAGGTVQLAAGTALAGGVNIIDSAGTNKAGVDANHNLYITNGGTATVVITASSAGAVKAAPGRLCRVLVTTAVTSAVSIFDNTNAASGTVIATIPTTAAVGTVYDVQLPAAVGIYVGGGTGSPGLTVSYS